MSMNKITHIVLHYSATYPDQQTTAADIDKMHKARGWRGIGYHWFIRRDGTVEQGRPESQVGAHVGGQNSGKIGVCCAGGIDRKTGPNVGVDNRTPAQIEAQITLIQDIRRRHPKAKVVGHRDLAPTQCPGFDARVWWAKVNKRKAPVPAPVPDAAPVKTPGVSEDDVHTVEKGDTLWSIAEEHDVPLARLLVVNGLAADDAITPGQTLRLKFEEDVTAKDTSSSKKVGVAGGVLVVLAAGVWAAWERIIDAVAWLVGG